MQVSFFLLRSHAASSVLPIKPYASVTVLTTHRPRKLYTTFAACANSVCVLQDEVAKDHQTGPDHPVPGGENVEIDQELLLSSGYVVVVVGS